jgi:hypothetical protein
LFFEDKKNILVVKEQENKESSPFSLFGVKSDIELDFELDAALQKSISMIGGADKEEIECCEGHPSKWKEFFDNNVLCDCTIQANDGKVSENDILIGRKKSYIFFLFQDIPSPPLHPGRKLSLLLPKVLQRKAE